MGRADPKQVMWWEGAFCFYWSFLIKFVNPAALYYMFIGILKDDIKSPYSNYSAGWQAIGWAIPIIGFVLFFGSFCLGAGDITLNYSEFELDEFKPDEPSKVHPEDAENKGATDAVEPIN